MNKKKRALLYYDRFGVKKVLQDVGPFGSLNINTGEYYQCKNMTHACRHTCGQNKKYGNRNWITCIRGDGYFYMW